jgi:hypothetical protein
MGTPTAAPPLFLSTYVTAVIKYSGDAYVFSNLSDGQTAILENQITNCVDVNVIC